VINFRAINNPPYRLEDIVGLIPYGLDENNTKSATEQLDDSYGHGGGWCRTDPKWTMNMEDYSIKYPGDPKMKPWAIASLRDETICVYESAWVAVIKPDRTFEISRMD
jgi:hypothetical protein